MKIMVHYPQGARSEALALQAFVDWQKLRYDMLELSKPETWVLAHTRGVPRPILTDDSEMGVKVLAVGYFEAVKWFQDNGLIIC